MKASRVHVKGKMGQLERVDFAELLSRVWKGRLMRVALPVLVEGFYCGCWIRATLKGTKGEAARHFSQAALIVNAIPAITLG